MTQWVVQVKSFSFFFFFFSRIVVVAAARLKSKGNGTKKINKQSERDYQGKKRTQRKKSRSNQDPLLRDLRLRDGIFLFLLLNWLTSFSVFASL